MYDTKYFGLFNFVAKNPVSVNACNKIWSIYSM